MQEGHLARLRASIVQNIIAVTVDICIDAVLTDGHDGGHQTCSASVISVSFSEGLDEKKSSKWLALAGSADGLLSLSGPVKVIFSLGTARRLNIVASSRLRLYDPIWIAGRAGSCPELSCTDLALEITRAT